MGWKETLTEMVDGYDSQISALRSQISTLQTKATDTQQQASALNITNSVDKRSAEQVLTSIAASFASGGGTYTVRYGKGFGSTNLTSWYIYYHGDKSPDFKPRVVYQFGGRGWDGNKTLLCLIEEFGFINDYVNVSITVGLYGLNGMTDLLNDGISKLEEMINKFEIAKRRLESFVTTGVSGCMINPYF